MALAIILAWYIGIGVLACVGSISLSQRFVGARHEATVYGVALVAIAAVYLGFAAYFQDASAWNLEASAVLAFAAMGLIGTRVPFVLIAGYALHGGWDLLHEIQAHSALDVFGGRPSTAIPLAYGAFCATFDGAIAIYFATRRRAWAEARKAAA